MKQKRISEIGTQQLLLDTYNIKTLLLQIENLSGDPSKNTLPQAAYSKLVNSRISHVEIVLKLVATPEEMLIERFKIMWPDGSSQDLQSIMALKDMKRQDQQRVLEAFGLSNPSNNQAAASKSSGTLGGGLTSMFQSSTVTNISNALRGTY